MTAVTPGSPTPITAPATPGIRNASPRKQEVDGCQRDVLSLPVNGNRLLNPDLSPAEFMANVQSLVAEAKQKPATRMQAASQLTELLDKYLQGTWTEKAQPAKKVAVLDGLKQLMGPRGQGNVVMAQIDSTPGDLAGNAKKIMAYIDAAEKIGVDTVVFPEMALMGYPIRDVIGRHPFVVDENVEWLNAIANRTGRTRALVGFVEPRRHDGQNYYGKKYFNSVAVLGNGKIEGLVRKSLLPTYNEFNEDRHFQPAPASGTHAPETMSLASWGIYDKARSGRLSNIHGQKVGISICEDIWNDDEFFDENLYLHDPYNELAEKHPDIMINCSASPSRARKEQMKNNMLVHMAERYDIPLVYVNRVGAVDEHSFDGSSRVYDGKGNLVARAKSFREQFLIANPKTGEGTIYSLPPGLEETCKPQKGKAPKVFDPYDGTDLGRTYETVVQGIRSYFQKTGLKKAVLGLSGGLDSSVAAVLLADAIGPQNVLGISLPSKITSKSSNDDAKILAENLGIQYKKSSIVSMLNVVMRGLNTLFKLVPAEYSERFNKTVTVQNIQARLRAVVLWAVSNEFKGVMPVATSDKSELYMGYATINGDMSGGFAPIADVCKTKLFALARWMNENRPQYATNAAGDKIKAAKNAIPEAVLEKKPGAELEIDSKTGKPLAAEDDLMPYEFMDEVIYRIENLKESQEQMLADNFWYEKEHPEFTKEDKQAWLDKFFAKMQAAKFKWTLLPPGVIVDSGSIMKADYQIPITSTFNSRGASSAEKAKALDGVLQES